MSYKYVSVILIILTLCAILSCTSRKQISPEVPTDSATAKIEFIVENQILNISNKDSVTIRFYLAKKSKLDTSTVVVFDSLFVKQEKDLEQRIVVRKNIPLDLIREDLVISYAQAVSFDHTSSWSYELWQRTDYVTTRFIYLDHSWKFILE